MNLYSHIQQVSHEMVCEFMIHNLVSYDTREPNDSYQSEDSRDEMLMDPTDLHNTLFTNSQIKDRELPIDDGVSPSPVFSDTLDFSQFYQNVDSGTPRSLDSGVPVDQTSLADPSAPMDVNTSSDPQPLPQRQPILHRHHNIHHTGDLLLEYRRQHIIDRQIFGENARDNTSTGGASGSTGGASGSTSEPLNVGDDGDSTRPVHNTTNQCNRCEHYFQRATLYTDMREVDVLEASHQMCALDVMYISSIYTNTLVGVHGTNYLNANLKPHDLQYLNPQMTLSKLSKLSKMILDYIIYYAGSVIIYL
jgi:hypothetical protein